MAPKPASTASKAPASTPGTASKVPAKTTAKKAAKKTAAPKAAAKEGDETKKKRRKTRKETYSSYIYKGMFTMSRNSGVDMGLLVYSPEAGPPRYWYLE
jgi:histone H2B